MGISRRQFITIDQQVAGEHSGSEGKNEPEQTLRHSERTPTFENLPYNSKNAHKWHEGIPPARRNYLGLYFRFAYYWNCVLLAPPASRSCRLFRIRFIHDCGFEWIRNVRFLAASRQHLGTRAGDACTHRDAVSCLSAGEERVTVNKTRLTKSDNEITSSFNIRFRVM